MQVQWLGVTGIGTVNRNLKEELVLLRAEHDLVEELVTMLAVTVVDELYGMVTWFCVVSWTV